MPEVFLIAHKSITFAGTGSVPSIPVNAMHFLPGFVSSAG